MNIFSNIGVTELIVILVIALLVVGPERLPELARQLGTLLRDLRKAYDNLTRDLGPELSSIQKTTLELRESVQAVRSIPQDLAKSVVQAADLDGTAKELKEVAGSVRQAGQALSDASQAKSLVQTALSVASSPPVAPAPAEPPGAPQSTAADDDGTLAASPQGETHE